MRCVQLMFATKRSIWPSSMLKTGDLEYRSLLLVAWMVRFWFKTLQNSTIHKKKLVQCSLFLLTVYMDEVPLYLCSIFCSHSQVRLSIASYRILLCTSLPLLQTIVFSLIILHFLDILDSHTCAALLMVENNKVEINITIQLEYITNLSLVPVYMSGFSLHFNLSP